MWTIERQREYKKEWSKNHPHYSRDYYRKNKGKMKLWRDKNRELHNNGVRKIRLRHKMELMNILCNGNICCQKCSFRDIRVLQFDHINNDGYKFRKCPSRANTSELWYYFKNPQKALGVLQVLCANCNWIKKVENLNSYHNKWKKEIRCL